MLLLPLMMDQAYIQKISLTSWTQNKYLLLSLLMAKIFCKHSNNLNGILDLTLFLYRTLNESAEAQEALEAAYKSGHQIASHTYSHQDLNTLDGDDFDREIVQLEQVVQDLIGVR